MQQWNVSKELSINWGVVFPCVLTNPIICENYTVNRISKGVYTVKNATTPERVIKGWYNLKDFVSKN